MQDLRRRWPRVEAALQTEGEIVITRYSKPIAKLVRVAPRRAKRKRWDPNEHMNWMKKVYGNKMFSNSDEQLAAARTERCELW